MDERSSRKDGKEGIHQRTRRERARIRAEAMADAAISVIADQGVRGLTHRAVDRWLGLPVGSTSYYFRTRAALLEGATERLVAMDREDVLQTGLDPQSISRLVHLWLQPARRERLRARFQLFLAAVCGEEAGSIMKARVQFRELVEEMLRNHGAVAPARSAPALIAAVEGLLLHGMMADGLADEMQAEVLTPVLARALGSSGE